MELGCRGRFMAFWYSCGRFYILFCRWVASVKARRALVAKLRLRWKRGTVLALRHHRFGVLSRISRYSRLALIRVSPIPLFACSLKVRLALFFTLPFLLGAHSYRPVPSSRKARIHRVIFMNALPDSAAAAIFSGTFVMPTRCFRPGKITNVFFDNCAITNSTSGRLHHRSVVERHLGTFLRGLRYTDGTAVTEVDVVATVWAA